MSGGLCAGFFTELKPSKSLQISAAKNSYIWSGVSATLNRSVAAGFLVYVEAGAVTTIEGFTYDRGWPESITELEVFSDGTDNC